MLVRMSLMKDNELYKRDWEIEGLVNFIGKHGLCRLRGRASSPRLSLSACNCLPFSPPGLNKSVRLYLIA